MINEDYIGYKSGKLTIIDTVDNKFFCVCDCDINLLIEKEYSKHDLFRLNDKKNIKSCGCEKTKGNIERLINARQILKNNHNNLMAQEIGKIYNGCEILDVWSNNRGHGKTKMIAKVKCFCGNIFETKIAYLKNQDTKSCGCLKEFAFGVVARNSLFLQRKTSAQERNIEWILDKKDFFKIIIDNCNYCGIKPSQILKTKSGDFFIYNGIDRLNNKLGYFSGNIMPCCFVCNRAKLDMFLEDFQAWITRICNKTIYSFEEIVEKQLPWKINSAFVEIYYSYFQNGFIYSRELFHGITQMHCHYCGIEPKRIRKKRKYSYIFNGIDKIDPNLGYVLDNIVPACWTCNSAKGNMSYNNFIAYLKRMRLFNRKWDNANLTLVNGLD